MRHIRLPRRLHLSPQEKDLRCLKLLGTEFAILSVIVAATYVVSTASARSSMCRSGPLFQVTGPWLRLRLNHTAAALFHPLAMRGSGSLPFLLIAKPPLMPTLTSSHLRPRSKSPMSVGAVIGLSAPDIEATEYFTGGQC